MATKNGFMSNLNMRCIEIQAALAYRLPHILSNLNMRCIEIIEALFGIITISRVEP